MSFEFDNNNGLLGSDFNFPLDSDSPCLQNGSEDISFESSGFFSRASSPDASFIDSRSSSPFPSITSSYDSRGSSVPDETFFPSFPSTVTPATSSHSMFSSQDFIQSDNTSLGYAPPSLNPPTLSIPQSQEQVAHMNTRTGTDTNTYLGMYMGAFTFAYLMSTYSGARSFENTNRQTEGKVLCLNRECTRYLPNRSRRCYCQKSCQGREQNIRQKRVKPNMYLIKRRKEFIKAEQKRGVVIKQRILGYQRRDDEY